MVAVGQDTLEETRLAVHGLRIARRTVLNGPEFQVALGEGGRHETGQVLTLVVTDPAAGGDAVSEYPLHLTRVWYLLRVAVRRDRLTVESDLKDTSGARTQCDFAEL